MVLGRAILKALKFLMSIIILFFLSGCIRSTAHIEIQKNGSMDLFVQTIIPKTATAMLSTNIEQQWMKRLSENGFEVENESDRENKILTVSKHFTSIKGLKKDASPNNDGMIKVFEKKHLLYKSYVIDADLDITEQINHLTEQAVTAPLMKSIISNQLEKASLQLEVSLPIILFTEHNADRIDRNTLIWDISAMEENTIHFEVIAPNWRAISVSFVIWLVVVIITVRMIVNRRKR